MHKMGLIASYVLLIYSQGVIVEEQEYKDYTSCRIAKHQESRKSGCVKQFAPQKNKKSVPVEDVST